MLEKFLNKKVMISFAEYGRTVNHVSVGLKGAIENYIRKGTVTKMDDNFIELDNNEVVAIKYITTIISL